MAEFEQHLTTEQLAQYAEALSTGNLDSVEPAIKNHVCCCDKCATEALELREILVDVEEAKLQKPINYRILYLSSIAAAILILVYIGFEYRWDNQLNKVAGNKPTQQKVDSLKQVVQEKTEQQNNNMAEPIAQVPHKVKEESPTPSPADKTGMRENEDKETTIKGTTSTEAKKNTPNKNPFFAANNSRPNKPGSTPVQNKELEILVKNYQGTNYRSNEIEVLNKSQDEITDEFILKVENEEAIPLIIEFYDANAEKVFEMETSKNETQIPWDLPKGVYYWKLMNEDFDLLFCGKFYAAPLNNE